MEQRKRIEESYKSAITELKKKSHYGGPDYEVILNFKQNFKQTVLPVTHVHFFLKTQWTQLHIICMIKLTNLIFRRGQTVSSMKMNSLMLLKQLSINKTRLKSR